MLGLELSPYEGAQLILAINSHSVSHWWLFINGAIHGSVSQVSHFYQETSRVFMHQHLRLCKTSLKTTISVHIQNINEEFAVRYLPSQLSKKSFSGI